MSRTIITHKRPITEEDLKLVDTTDGKLIFTKYKGNNCSILLCNERIICADFYGKTASLVGAVYIARVKDVVKNLSACFVEIAKGQVCFLPISPNDMPILFNRKFDGRLVQGDELLVHVVKDAQKTKQPVVSWDFTRFKNKEELIKNAMHRTPFTCIVQPQKPWVNVLEKITSFEEYQDVITDDAVLYQELTEYFKLSNIEKNVRLYQDNFSLSLLYSIESKMEMALESRIWLKSGAYLILEHTEAMTVIDVNSGKFEASKDKEDYYRQINLEACKEIALQLRLRNISGIVMVDLINMKAKEDQDEILHYMRQLVKELKFKTIVVDITPLGIMEITRQKSFKSLSEQVKHLNF